MKKFLTPAYYRMFSLDIFLVPSILIFLLSLIAAYAFNPVVLEFLFVIVAVIFAIPTLMYILSYHETYRLSLTHLYWDLKLHELTTKPRKGLKEIEKLIFISDIHFNEFNPKSFPRKLIARINKEKPGLLILGGDYVHDLYTDLELLSPFSKLGNFPKIAVLGNHDYSALTLQDVESERLSDAQYGLADKITGKLEKMGIKVLRNDNFIFRLGRNIINFYGVDDLWAKNADFSKYKKQENNVLVVHSPQEFHKLSEECDFVLSGHNHGGGQLKLRGFTLLALSNFLPLSFTRILKQYFGRYDSGIFKNKYGIEMFLSRGVGLSGLGVRINCRPEIAVIHVMS